MSTGADCTIWQNAGGYWFYDLQRFPYGRSMDYDRYGPFNTEEDADDHLRAYHANPGGTWTRPYEKDRPYRPTYNVQQHTPEPKRRRYW